MLVSCDNTLDNKQMAMESIGNFATQYFNYNFAGAMEYCTPESRKWISLAATNVTEADLEVLRAKEDGAMAEVLSIDFGAGDTTATATVRVVNFMLADTIGVPGHIEREAVYRLPAVLRDGRWLVRMACPPRSEK